MVEVFANSEDLYQISCSAASDLGLHCLPRGLQTTIGQKYKITV